MAQPLLTRALIGKILASPGEVLRFLFYLPKLLILIYRLMHDRRVSVFTKCIPFLALVYIVFPMDLVKEIFFGPLGFIDDIVVTYYLLKTFIKMCPSEVVEEHVRRLSISKPETARKGSRTEPPKG